MDPFVDQSETTYCATTRRSLSMAFLSLTDLETAKRSGKM